MCAAGSAPRRTEPSGHRPPSIRCSARTSSPPHSGGAPQLQGVGQAIAKPNVRTARARTSGELIARAGCSAGSALADRPRGDLADDALQMAIAYRRKPEAGLVHYSRSWRPVHVADVHPRLPRGRGSRSRSAPREAASTPGAGELSRHDQEGPHPPPLMGHQRPGARPQSSCTSKRSAPLAPELRTRLPRNRAVQEQLSALRSVAPERHWFSYDERPDMKPGPRSVVVVEIC
jgi:hypothetical protein